MIDPHAFLKYNGLFGDNNVSLPDFINSEALALRSKTYNWLIEEHLHTNLFQVFFISKGQGEMSSEGKSFELKAPCLITVPSNELHGFKFHPKIQGNVVTLSESYLESILENHQNILRIIQRLMVYQLEFKTDTVEEIATLNERITTEIGEPEQYALQPLLQLLFIAIYRLNQTIHMEQTTAKNPYLKIFNDYHKLIRKSIKNSRSVSDCANELGITTVHLNRVCKAVVNKSALKIIHEKLIEESKKYLLNTDYSVSEISYKLDFNDPAHFTKLFKKYVGVAPSEFRKN